MREFQPLNFDHCKNNWASNEVIMKLLWGGSGGITILELFNVDTNLFELVKKETELILSRQGQEFHHKHPTVVYVSKQDKNWKPRPETVQQYSLYNSKDDYVYNEDDHRWSDVKRIFNSELEHIPAFFKKYFEDSELQNFRLQSLTKEGSLGKHREKIIGIPGRESHYKVRFHLPIVTNEGVSFYMDGQDHKMLAGKVYVFNQSCLHDVNNAGDALRTHLVWDTYLNDHIINAILLPALERSSAPE